ncbi:MAG TPA: hypothetical protein V6D04_05485 [Candidatus Obscuribacterales bacterium]
MNWKTTLDNWQPLLNIFFPLASTVLVVIISSLTNMRLKRIDVELRKADHNQEFRKMYAAKRIEASEQYICRLAAIIEKFDVLRAGLLTADFDEESNNAYSDKLLKKTEEVQAAADAITSKSLNTAYLYFDENLIEQKDNPVAPRLILAEKAFVDTVKEKKRIWKLFKEADVDTQSKQNLKHSYQQKGAELEQAKKNYIQHMVEFRQYLVGICSAIRKDLAKQGLPKGE